MRRRDADDYGSAVDPQGPGPLFERVEGPFSRSKITPSREELMVACLIWQHCGRNNPIAIADIIAKSGVATVKTERQVKDVVEQLRLTHRILIGAKREAPFGYFRVMDAEDLEVAVRPYKHQIRAMGRVLRAMLPQAEVSEFFGQLQLDTGEK
jgi:hypothetical protein